MTASLLIRRLLAIFVIAGLMFAPLVAAANAGASTSIDSMQMPSMQMPSMPDDMPFCPDKSQVDCDNCPLMAICALKPLQAFPATAVSEVLPTTLRMIIPRSDPEAENLGHPPPSRPPRSLVRSA